MCGGNKCWPGWAVFVPLRGRQVKLLQSSWGKAGLGKCTPLGSIRVAGVYSMLHALYSTALLLSYTITTIHHRSLRATTSQLSVTSTFERLRLLLLMLRR